MALSDFTVLYDPHEHDGTIIHCFDGRDLVVGFVTRTALADYFGWPKPGRDAQHRPSIKECNLVVDRHLDAFQRIIEAKYGRGESSVLNRFGSSLPLVAVELPDIERSGAVLTDKVIDMSRASRFG